MIKNTKKSKDMFQTEGYSMTRGPSFTLSEKAETSLPFSPTLDVWHYMCGWGFESITNSYEIKNVLTKTIDQLANVNKIDPLLKKDNTLLCIWIYDGPVRDIRYVVSITY